jgi:O-antigen/teichoic acid export membrane protein
VLLLFAGELLKLFGESATSDSRTLVTLIAGAILVAYPLTNVNNSLVTAREKMNVIFVNNAIGVVASLFLYAWLGGRLGLVGVGWAFVTLQLLMLLLSSIAVGRTAAVPFPLGAWAVSIAAVVAGAGAGALFDGGSLRDVALKAGVLAVFVPILLATRLVSRAELEDVIALVVPGRWFSRAGAAA